MSGPFPNQYESYFLKEKINGHNNHNIFLKKFHLMFSIHIKIKLI